MVDLARSELIIESPMVAALMGAVYVAPDLMVPLIFPEGVRVVVWLDDEA